MCDPPRVGKGGMGSVFLAHDSQLDRTVALKIPLLDGSGDSQVLERFYREARSAAALNHPGICLIHGIGEVDRIPFLTMAFIQGKPLGDYIRIKPLGSAPREWKGSESNCRHGSFVVSQDGGAWS
jgi:serine/threonine protein kinase